MYSRERQIFCGALRGCKSGWRRLIMPLI
jgi:hypothetical protein